MKIRFKIMLEILLLLLFLTYLDVNSSATCSNITVTADTTFHIYDFETQNPLSEVEIVLINQSGDIVDIINTDESGTARKCISISIDEKYYDEKYVNDLDVRGTVTAIAYKSGYLDTISFETPISINSTSQNIYMKKTTPGGRNEPDIMLGNNHHLEINVLAEKYAPHNITNSLNNLCESY